MEKKTLGFIILVIGIIVFLIALLADTLGIGGFPGIGTKQTIGIIAGLVICISGLLFLRK